MACLTSGERMVYAAEFVRAFNAGSEREDDTRLIEAATSACGVVWALRAAKRQTERADVDVDDEARAMLADMLSTGGDR